MSARHKSRHTRRRTAARFTERKSPFDDVALSHTVIKTLASCGHDVKDQGKLLRQFRHVEYGLSAQKECAAILAWLGNCVFVHELEQDAHAADGFGPIQVPDLFAVFSRRGEQLRVLIEVKSTDKLFVPWSDEYRAGLARYGELLGLPVLLAWRPRKFGKWLLMDGMCDELGTDGRIPLKEAVMHNLMGVIGGDFQVVPKPGVGLNFRAKIIRKVKRTEESYIVKFEITDAFFGTRTQNLEPVTVSSQALILTTASDEYLEEAQQALSWGYLTPAQPPEAPPQGPCAQDLLRTLVGWAKKHGERIAWGQVLKAMETIIPKKQMERELSQDIGKTVRYILHWRPSSVPSFLPQAWWKSETEDAPATAAEQRMRDQ